MRRTPLVLLLILLSPLPASAQLRSPVRMTMYRVRENVRVHKYVYFADFSILATGLADAFTTMYAERRCQRCVDMGFFGPHPSGPEVFLGTMGFAFTSIFFNHYSYAHAEDVVGQRFFVALFTIPHDVGSIADITDNLNAPRFSTRQSAARARLLRGARE